MIRLIIQGGLGNQMFQYATALALAAEHNNTLCIDTSLIDLYGNRSWCRPYELKIFTLNSEPIQSHRHLSVRLLPKISLSLRKRGIYGAGKYLFEMNEPLATYAHKDYELFGYFTNCHLFEPYRQQLLSSFTFLSEPNQENKVLLQSIGNTNSVSVHIRRGDYINATNDNIFFHPDVEWYKRAMTEIEKQVQQPIYYFFSDDIEWVKNQFSHIWGAVFVDINHGKDSYNDMRLMAACKHNIIANSTFSWWSAWLNRNTKKIVIAPDKYYKDPQRQEKYLSQMIPNGWITL